jgi:hypothetical protein
VILAYDDAGRSIELPDASGRGEDPRKVTFRAEE